MGASQALVLERLLEGNGLARKAGGLLSGLGARVCRASELAPPAVKESLATSIPALDRLLPGGLSKGSLVEIAGRRSSGRFSLALSALAAVTSTGQAAALVDLGDQLDPQGAEAAGVDLARLFWVRPRRAKEALAAAEMLVAAGFPLVVADLGLSPKTRLLPDAAWVRLARAAQAHGATLFLSTPWRSSGIAADVVLSSGGARSVWRGGGGAPRLLSGLASRLTLEKLGRVTPGRAAPMALSVLDARSPLPSRRDSRDPRMAVETRIKAHDSRNPAALHDRQVKRVEGL